MRSILITKDVRHAREVDPNLMESATVEALRACAFAADVVLIPASEQLLPLAAVIAHDVRRAVSQDADRVWQRPGRFVPLIQEQGKIIESLQPFLRIDWGNAVRDPTKAPDLMPVAAALRQYRPDTIVALTIDESVLDLLHSIDLKPRVLYFRTLMGDKANNFEKQFKPFASGVFNLEENLGKFDDHDIESGRSADTDLEPFVPFGVLLQDSLVGK
jgi:hypothetical protein